MNKGLQNFPILITERLTLRQLSIDDTAEILLLRSDDEINKFFNRKPSRTLNDALHFIKIIIENDDTFYWAVTKTGDEKLIGTICLFDFEDDTAKCEIGYELRTEYQGQGIMAEAARNVIQYAADTLGIKTIDASTHKDNKSSTTLLQKLNFKNLESINPENPNLISFRLIKFK
ncbi:GNAT family N-acetyltransferase [Flavobacterium marginilacus]|uniref:GNAT family N-acetyltransferase n=1 Tax=Flavobacterium marginilacus TaxID=3003256 RepID=UPI00248DD294|nr:GNAT family N-acetyltransferase [Flavobacterium marginilacus]